jgi:SAM-dependent methyltransferase
MTSVKTQTQKEWEEGLLSELNYWDNWFRNQGGKWANDYKNRLNPDTPLRDYIISNISSVAGRVKILDVGSGPITNIGFSAVGKDIEITAVDPLADMYNELISKYNVMPPVKTQRGSGETLLETFEKESFDLVHTSNALDHSYDPLLAIKNMYELCKKGGGLST